MPGKYSHVKKRTVSGLLDKKSSTAGQIKTTKDDPSHSSHHHPQQHQHNHHSAHHHHHHHRHGSPDPHIDRSLSPTSPTSISTLEKTIARILLLRYEHDIARLFSAHLYHIAITYLPTFLMRCMTIGGPSWVAFNASNDELKDFFRAVVGMDMRQAGERVATKSVLWSYTALRYFAMSNNVPICRKRGLHSVRLLPYYAGLKSHLDALESLPPPKFEKPPHLPAYTPALATLHLACSQSYSLKDGALTKTNWRPMVDAGFERLVETLWGVASEFDVRGYGLVLREKLVGRWCDCGCSTDHLGEVCERTVREGEEARARILAGKGKNRGKGKIATEGGSAVERNVKNRSAGKMREWDGRGQGIRGWETEEEEDLWEAELDFAAGIAVEGGGGTGRATAREENLGEFGLPADMSVGELMELRYLKAEHEKELGNIAFRKGNFEEAAEKYEIAHGIEPELPYYQLNLAAAHLKLANWIMAEKACTKALGQHRSTKGYFRRAKARKMLGKRDGAVRDLKALLELQPANEEARAELAALIPPVATVAPSTTPALTKDTRADGASASASSSSFKVKENTERFKEKEKEDTIGEKDAHKYPFARTKADDVKIKIMHLPTIIDIPVGIYGHGSDENGKSRGEEESGNKGGEMKTQAETFSYPCWDRYRLELCGNLGTPR